MLHNKALEMCILKLYVVYGDVLFMYGYLPQDLFVFYAAPKVSRVLGLISAVGGSLGLVASIIFYLIAVLCWLAV